MKKILFNPFIEEIDKYVELASKYDAGFEYDDFFMPDFLEDKKAVKDRINLYKNLGRDMSSDTLHGSFMDIVVNSIDRRIFEASDYRVRESMDIASELGVKGVVFHTNFLANFKAPFYLEQWLEGNEKYWRRITAEYPKLNVYMENMFDMEHDLLQALAQKMGTVPNFGVCLDVAHANISNEPLECWYDSVLRFTKHIHINDNCGIVDSHDAVGSQKIDWKAFSDAVSTYKQEISVLIEVYGTERLEESLKYMEEKNIFPFVKRG